jgi:hypothetical protein
MKLLCIEVESYLGLSERAYRGTAKTGLALVPNAASAMLPHIAYTVDVTDLCFTRICRLVILICILNPGVGG